MNALELLKAMQEAVPDCRPSLTLEEGRLLLSMYDGARGVTFRGALDPEDEARPAADVAAELAAWAASERERLDGAEEAGA